METQNVIPILQYGTKPVKNYSHSLLKKSLPSVFGIDMYNLFRRSKIVLNKHIGVAGSYAGNMRLFEVTGVGSCLLTDNKSNLGDLFDINKEIVVFDSTDDCIQKAKWLLENEEERRSIALAGQKRTLKSHTVENRCRLILEIIEKELNHTSTNKSGMNKLKFSIVGCGRIAVRHAEQISRLATLTAVCDINKSRADELGQKYKSKVYYDIDDLLFNEKGIDVVSICSPNGLHAEHSIKVFRSGISCFMRKTHGN